MVEVTREPRIGVDARPLCHPGTGIHRYTSELLRRLCRRGGEWFFYSPQPYDTEPFQGANVHHRTLALPTSWRASQLAHLVFPYWARKDRVGVFWGPRHQLPALLPSRVHQVLTIHDFVWRRFASTMRFPGRQIEALFTPPSLGRARHIAVVSAFTAGELRELYPQFADKSVTVSGASVPLGGDTASATSPGDASEEGADRGADRGFWLFVGTMEPRKNLERLLQAYREYVRQLPVGHLPRPLRLAGGRGWGAGAVSRQITELGLEGLVSVLGRVSDSELQSLYRRAHALLMPSLYEGFGLPVAEAMSAGLPVLTSRSSPMAEIAEDAGILVNPLSVGDMAAALLLLDRDVENYRKMREACTVRASHYSWDRSADLMWRLLTREPRAGVGSKEEAA